MTYEIIIQTYIYIYKIFIYVKAQNQVEEKNGYNYKIFFSPKECRTYASKREKLLRF